MSGRSIPAIAATSRAQRPGGVHHPGREDIALFGAHDPGAVRLRLRPDHRGEAVDLRPPLARAHRIGIGHARGVHIAAIGLEHDAADAVEIDQRVQTLGLVAADLVEIHAVTPRLGLLQAQLVLPVLGLREIEEPGLEHAAGLAGLGLQLLVERHRVVLQPRDVGAVMQPVDIRRRVPGGARGQLVALQQDHLRPAGLAR
jgi:hypothetical protein